MSDSSKLSEIKIRNLGIIEDASLELRKGFTVLTGETGAGKTMVLTALALVLGGKADSSLVRQGKDRLIASATFTVSEDVASQVADHGGAIEEDQLILTRSMSSDGKSRATVGGVPVPANVLATLTDSLIEIHGQSANMSITKPSKQREMLDRFGGATLAFALKEYTEAFERYNDLEKKYATLRAHSKISEREIASLRMFQSSFDKVKPKPGEMDSLSQEISRLSSVEVLRTAVSESAALLDDEERGILRELSRAIRNLESVESTDAAISEILAPAKESLYLLDDAIPSLHRYLEELDADPLRLEAALARRAEIANLIKVFSQPADVEVQVVELIERFAHVTETIDDLAGGEGRLSELENEIEEQRVILLAKASLLSHCRLENGERLSALVTEEIHALAMQHTRFICKIVSPDYFKPVSISRFTSTGADDVVMMLQMQADGVEVLVSKGASGGEMSRIMLALEVVLASSQPVGTYIFDEVDAGVGGKAAIEVGKRLLELSRHAQVIVVTHLAQVAAWADSHFVIRKSSDGSVTQSDVFEVEAENRIEEIARMLAGHEDSKSAREHAAELLLMRVE